jgi:hypothetical protein
LLEGKSMHITMASVHKPKTHDAPDRRHPVGEVPAEATAETPATSNEEMTATAPRARPAASTVAETATAPPAVPVAVVPPPAKAAAPEPEPVQAGE